MKTSSDNTMPIEVACYPVTSAYCKLEHHGSVQDSCCDMGQNDTIGKIELNPSFVLSSENTNYKNDIQ